MLTVYKTKFEIQSSRTEIQPGFLSNQVEKSLNLPLVRADFHLEGQKTWLDVCPPGLDSDALGLKYNCYAAPQLSTGCRHFILSFKIITLRDLEIV